MSLLDEINEVKTNMPDELDNIETLEEILTGFARDLIEEGTWRTTLEALLEWKDEQVQNELGAGE